MARPSKRPEESLASMTREMFQKDANSVGAVFGGRLLELLDEVAGIAAKRHARRHCVTAAIHHMVFEKPLGIGDFVHITGRVAYVGRTSMTVRVEVEREVRDTGARVRAAIAHFTFVGVDGKGKPVEVPLLTISSEEEKGFWAEAERLRKQ